MPPRRESGRPGRALAAAASLGLLGTLLAIPLGPLPPLGPLLDPANGVWAVARSAAIEAHATAPLPGLEHPVHVIYDHRGVPHIFASTEADLYRAQGYVVARDRLFQLELQTRATAGRLTEWVGAVALPADRTMRQLGLARVADRHFAELDPGAPDRQALDAFADGVNAWIAQADRRHLPLEYRLLNVRPEAWRAEYSLYLLQRMNWTLAYGQFTRRRAQLAALIGEEQADALLPARSPIQEPIVPSGRPTPRFERSTLPPPVASASTTRALLDAPHSQNGLALGSNNWAVAGTRTRTGYPILAGDPHLELTLPSIWYEIHLVVPGVMDVYGATIPGAPGVIIGFNRHLAWSFTNTEADVMDYYRERVDDLRAPGATRLDGKWLPTDQRITTYRDRQGEPIATDTLYTSHRGPLMMVDGAWTSLRWTALEPSRTQLALLGAMKARDAEHWLDLMEDFAVPPQNAIVADREGTIAIRSTGRFPLRPAGRGGRYLDGATRRFDWSGYWPAARMPTAIDPTQGYLASANQQPVDPSIDSSYLGADWRQPWRALHINRLLGARDDWTVRDMARMQTDPGSAKADHFLPYFIAALGQVPQDDPRFPEASATRRLLADWDRRYTRENERAILFELAMDALESRTWDEIAEGNDLVLTPATAVLTVLLEYPASRWWDIRHTPALEDRDSVLIQSALAAYQRARERYGPVEDGGWRWDRVRTMQIRHLLHIPALSALDVPNQGGSSTLSPMGAAGTHGASWRMVVELGPTVRAWTIYPGGQSGNPASEWYRDRIERWSRGELDPVLFPSARGQLSSAEIRARLDLRPAP